MSETLALTKDEAIEVITCAFPYPSHITHWDTSEDDAVRFTWRGVRFRLSLRYSLMVEEVDRSFLSGSDIAILAESLIKRVYLDRAARVSSQGGER